MLGASPWRAFREVTLPLLAAGHRVGRVDRVPVHVHVVRRRSCSSAGPQFATLEVEIYRQTAQLLDLRAAADAGAPPAGRRCARCCSSTRAARSGRPSGSGSLPRRASARTPRATGASGLPSAVNLRAAGAAARPAAGRPRRAVAGDGERLRPRRVLAALVRRAAAARRCSCRPSRRSATRSLFAAGHAAACRGRSALLAAAVIAYRRGWLAQRLRRAADAAARHLGGDRRLRLPRRARHAAARPARRRPCSSRSPTRSSRCRSSCAPSCRSCGRSTAGCARPRPCSGASPSRAWREVDVPIVGRALLVGAGFAFAVSLGRVRRDAVHRSARHADDAGRHLPPARPAGRARFGQAMAMARCSCC